MKVFQKSLFLVVLFVSFAPAVFAQSATFTLLPGTDSNYDTIEKCQPLIDQYVIDQKMPSAAQTDASAYVAMDGLKTQVSDAQNLVDKANQNYQDYSKYIQMQKDVNDLSKCSPDPMVQAADNYPSVCLTSPDYQKNLQDPKNLSELKTNLDAANQAKAELDQATKNLSDLKSQYDKAVSQLGELDSGTSAQDKAAQNLSMRQNLLGCAIRTGRISLSMIPYFITYIINFALGFVGLISLLFVVIGGYHYVLGGLGEDKEKGKNTIKNALIGMAVALLAWSAVNVIIQILTS